MFSLRKLNYYLAKEIQRFVNMDPDVRTEQDEDAASDYSLKLPISVENELKLPLSVLFTGNFNGFGVEIKSQNEMSLLYRWSCFGKGSFSRSKPSVLNRDRSDYQIFRKRQFAKREEWLKKFNEKRQPSLKEKCLQSDITKIIGMIKESSEGCKDVIDLVSSDDEMDTNEPNGDESDLNGPVPSADVHSAGDTIAIVVPNSDSEGDDYFKDFKPKCCVNKTKIDECLILMLQEAYFLAYAFGCLQITDFENNPLSLEESWKLFIDTDKHFVVKYIVYHYFKSKGYVVKPGIKFGGDYLLYKEGPGRAHADYIVVIKYEDSDFESNWLPTLGHIRMAGTTSKNILMAEVLPHLNSTQGLPKPQDLINYSVRETILSRKLPCNKDDDEE